MTHATRIRTPLAIGAALAILLLVASASGSPPDGYRGATEAGGLIAVRVDYDHKGNPARVHSLRWANVPVSCGTFQSATTGDVDVKMKVDRHGAFKGSDKPDIGDATATISGRFKRNPAKASGTFRVKGTVPGCPTADTGSLRWDMKRK
jgi:hypothetical protein